MRVDLPSGGWIEVRGVDELRSKDAREMQKKFVLLAGEDEGLASRANYVYAVDRILEVCITDWSLPYLPDAKCPRNQPAGEASNLGELTIADMRKIEAVADEIREAVFPTDRGAALTEDGKPDPATPTEPANVQPSV